MRAYFKEDLKRAFWSRMTLLSVVLSILLFFGGFAEYLGWLRSGVVSVFYLFTLGYESGIAIVFPLIACLPFAGSFVKDCKSGVVKDCSSKRGYLWIRFLVNGLVGGFVLFIGPLVGFLFLLGTNLIIGTAMNGQDTEIYGYFSRLGIQSPIVIMILLLIGLFCCGFIMASMALGLSVFIQNPYIVTIFPFVLYLFTATVLLDMNPSLNLLNLYSLTSYGHPMSDRVLYGAVLLAASMISFIAGGNRRIQAYVSGP